LEVIGQISKKNEELSYGFVAVKGSEDVFFSPKTEFSHTDFASLRVGDKVKIIVTETERGLFASSLSTVNKIKTPSEIEL
jgi:cold shock CspA family protein